MQKKTSNIEFYKNSDGDLFLIKNLECFKIKKCSSGVFWVYQWRAINNHQLGVLKPIHGLRNITKLELMALELEGVKTFYYFKTCKQA